jgi:SAM-dependent methyltransferase
VSAVRDSPYWQSLLERYARSPSIALCRVPEVELFSRLELREPVLDHCCGDGFIAAMAFPGRVIDAGIDLSEPALAAARERGNYRRLERADAARELPFPPASFSTVINNSGIEHIPDLNAALAQLARVVRPGGRLYFNVLNSRYFDWWPLAPGTAAHYRRFQPFHHALDEHQWTQALERQGFVSVTFADYFPKATAQLLADYDYRYSAFYLRRSFQPAVAAAAVMPKSSLVGRWARLLGPLEWTASQGQGAGFMVSATRA